MKVNIGKRVPTCYLRIRYQCEFLTNRDIFRTFFSRLIYQLFTAVRDCEPRVYLRYANIVHFINRLLYYTVVRFICAHYFATNGKLLIRKIEFLIGRTILTTILSTMVLMKIRPFMLHIVLIIQTQNDILFLINPMIIIAKPILRIFNCDPTNGKYCPVHYNAPRTGLVFKKYVAPTARI